MPLAEHTAKPQPQRYLQKLSLMLGLDPTVVIGGKLKNLKTNARLGQGDIFITEADEYDRSFLALSPNIAVLTT